MAETVNQASANSVLEQPADSKIPNDGTGVLQLDPYLEPFKDVLKRRFSTAQEWIKTINEHEGGLEKFSKVSHSGSWRRKHQLTALRVLRNSASMCRAMET